MERDFEDYVMKEWRPSPKNSLSRFWRLEFRMIYGVIRGENWSRETSIQKYRRIRTDRDPIEILYEFEGWGRYHSFRPMQMEKEIQGLYDFVSNSSFDKVLEVGSARNSTLVLWSELGAKKIYSIDLPESDSLRNTLDKEKMLDTIYDSDFKFIRGNSHTDSIEKKIEDSIRFELLFLDADHTYDGVKEDFNRYSKYLKEGAMIIFHDINNENAGVPKFWDELKEDFETEEILDENSNSAGIGILKFSEK